MKTDSPDWDRVRRIQGGEDRAFDDLMERYKRPVTSFVFRLTGDDMGAEDVAQDVFVRAYRAIAGGRVRQGRGEFSTWLFQIARNAALDHLRSRRRRPTEPLSAGENGDDRAAVAPTAPEAMVAGETGARIAAAVAALPEDQRAAVVLAEYEGLPYAAIAAVMKTSIKSVELRLYRARKFLRRRLRDLL